MVLQRNNANIVNDYKSSRAFRMVRWRTKDGYMCPLSKKLMIKLLHLKQLQPADFAAFVQTKTLDEQEIFFLISAGKIGTAADDWL